jgi:hypothetical protein
MDQQETMKQHKNFKQLVMKLVIHLKSQLFDEKFVLLFIYLINLSSHILFLQDFEFIADQGEVADILQCNNEASSATSRGHQFPAAFLARVSGLDKHGRNSAQPLRYTHLDIAGSAGELPHSPTGRPIPALCQMFIADRVL